MAKRRKTLSRVFLQLPGRHQPEGASARWKMVPAPADTGGRNAAVPPPLRVVHYCPTHWRSWLTNAHKELPTKIIFAHILQRARPMFGADRPGGVVASGDEDASTSDATAETLVANGGRGAGKASRKRNRRSSIARKLSQNITAKRQRKQSGFVDSGHNNSQGAAAGGGGDSRR